MPVFQDDLVPLTSTPDSAARPRSPSVSSSCTLDKPDKEPNSLDIFDDEVIDLTDNGSGATEGSLLRDGEYALEKVRIRGQHFAQGDIVEVHGIHLGMYPVNFIEVKVAIRNRAGAPKLRGVPLTRTRHLMGKLPKKLNEVCMILYIGRTAPNEQPIFVDADPDSIVKKRVLVVTNADYPEHCSSTLSLTAPIGDKERQKRRVEHTGVLVCRWRFKVYFTTVGRKIRPDEEALERISSADVPDSKYRLPDEALCNRWRGQRIKGGSWNGGQPLNSDLIDLDAGSQASAPNLRGNNQKYTVFDAFSGAGGVSRGAQSAGFKIQYAVDKSPDVWPSYKLNFPGTKLYELAIDEFIRRSRGEHIRVDVLHLSPPCQFFSPAHTHESAHDDENISALFGCNTLINKTRPRLITVEQTFGIMHDRHLHYLRTLIGDFTQFGYSIRWRVVRLCTWGLAQDRKRLVVIAAAPGERLPPFPPATHSETGGSGCRPFTTIRQAIRGIPEQDELHNVRGVRQHQPPRPRLDANRLAGTITTGSGDIYHPDGTRDLTLREYACLQGFPHHHSFLGNKTSIQKQIGNAFPPNTVRVLYKHLQEWLLQEDGLKPFQPPAGAVLALDDGPETTPGLTERFDVESSPSMMDVMELDDDDVPAPRARIQGEVIDLT